MTLGRDRIIQRNSAVQRWCVSAPISGLANGWQIVDWRKTFNALKVHQRQLCQCSEINEVIIRMCGARTHAISAINVYFELRMQAVHSLMCYFWFFRLFSTYESRERAIYDDMTPVNDNAIDKWWCNWVGKMGLAKRWNETNWLYLFFFSCLTNCLLRPFTRMETLTIRCQLVSL